MIGGAVLIFLYLAAIFAGFIAPYDYQRLDRDRFFQPPIWPKLQDFIRRPGYEQLPGDFVYRQVPGDTKPLHFLSMVTNTNCSAAFPPRSISSAAMTTIRSIFWHRPVWPRCFLALLYGSQISLSIGVIGILLSFSFGMMIGGIGRLFRRRDRHRHHARGANSSCPFRAVPHHFAARHVSAEHEFRANLRDDHYHLSFIGWASMARVIRGMTLSLREQQFILAARTLGQSHLKIIVRHILPNTFSYVIVAANLSIPYYILGEVVLSFLGVGIQEPSASWGLMLNAAQNTEYMRKLSVATRAPARRSLSPFWLSTFSAMD